VQLTSWLPSTSARADRVARANGSPATLSSRTSASAVPCRRSIGPDALAVGVEAAGQEPADDRRPGQIQTVGLGLEAQDPGDRSDPEPAAGPDRPVHGRAGGPAEVDDLAGVPDARGDPVDDRHAGGGELGAGPRLVEAAADPGGAGDPGGQGGQPEIAQVAGQVARAVPDQEVEGLRDHVDDAAGVDLGGAQIDVEVVGVDDLALVAHQLALEVGAAQPQLEAIELLGLAGAEGVQSAAQPGAGQRGDVGRQVRGQLDLLVDAGVEIEPERVEAELGRDLGQAAAAAGHRVLEVAGVGGQVEHRGGAGQLEVERRLILAHRDGQVEAGELHPDLGRGDRPADPDRDVEVVAARKALRQPVGQGAGAGDGEVDEVVAAEEVGPVLEHGATGVDHRALGSDGAAFPAHALGQGASRPLERQLIEPGDPTRRGARPPCPRSTGAARSPERAERVVHLLLQRVADVGVRRSRRRWRP
jgi:hypothetical protein